MNPAKVLQEAKAVIFDFDGPICSVFAGYPASEIAKNLFDTFGTPETSDPFEVLRYAIKTHPKNAFAVHQELESEELKAISLASSTPGAVELLQFCSTEEKQIAVASNNSVKAVVAYLWNINFNMKVISGRDERSYEKLKPEPHILLDAVEKLSVQIKDCVFIGDSISDLEVAQKVDMPFIGYANKEHKFGKLGETQVSSIHQLL